MTDKSADLSDAAGKGLSPPQLALRDAAQMVRFYSRLPMPRLPFEADAHAMPDFRRAPRMLPFAALLIALPGAMVVLVTGALGLPPMVVAGLALAVSVLATGAFHEDGLADTFDGLGGGVTPERRLEIMKDSRIGAFGGSALILSLGLRWSLAAALLPALGAVGGAALWFALAPVSRVAGLLPLTLLPPARPDGFSAAVGRPTGVTFLIALALSVLFAVVLGVVAGVPLAGIALGVVLALLMALLIGWWAQRAINGQTGDIAGAAQQLGEIAFLMGVLISVTP